MLVLIVADVVQKVEFRFRTPVTRIRDAGGLEIRLCLLGDMPYITGIILQRDRIFDVTRNT